MDLRDLDRRFNFHPATDTTGPMHDNMRKRFRQLARHVDKVLDDSREKSLVITALEEGMMWANAGIARNTES